MVIDPNPWRTVLAAVIVLLLSSTAVALSLRGAVWVLYRVWCGLVRIVQRYRVQRELAAMKRGA